MSARLFRDATLVALGAALAWWLKPGKELRFELRGAPIYCYYTGDAGSGLITEDEAGNLSFQADGGNKLTMRADQFKTVGAMLDAINKTPDWRCRAGKPEDESLPTGDASLAP